MARKRMLKLLPTLLLSLLAAGCWDNLDINDRNIVTAVVVDKTDYGYALYVEIPTIAGGSQSGEGGGQKKLPAVVRSEGRTYEEANENRDRAMDRPVYLGAVQSVVFTDRLAAFGIEEYLMRMRQIQDYRKTVHVVVTAEAPERLLREVPANAQSVGFSIDQTLMALINTKQLHHISLMDVLESLSSPYKHFILPNVNLVDTEPAFVGFTVLSGGMKTGFIPAEETKTMCFILVDDPIMRYVVPYKDTFATVVVRLPKKKIKPEYANDKASFTMDLKFQATLLYPETNKTIAEIDMEMIRETLRAMLEKDFAELFMKSQTEYDFDVFELHTPFRIAYPNEYKTMDWAGEYRKAVLLLSVSVDMDVTETVDYKS